MLECENAWFDKPADLECRARASRRATRQNSHAADKRGGRAWRRTDLACLGDAAPDHARVHGCVHRALSRECRRRGHELCRGLSARRLGRSAVLAISTATSPRSSAFRCSALLGFLREHGVVMTMSVSQAAKAGHLQVARVSRRPIGIGPFKWRPFPARRGNGLAGGAFQIAGPSRLLAEAIRYRRQLRTPCPSRRTSLKDALSNACCARVIAGVNLTVPHKEAALEFRG